MGCFLLDCIGLGFFRVRCAVLLAEMVACISDKPVSGLHRNHQLRNLFAGEDSVGCRKGAPYGPASASGVADYDCCYLRDGGLVMESTRKTSPQVETIL